MDVKPTKRSIDIIIVEDKYDDAILMVMELENAGFDVSWSRVETAQQLEDHLTPTIDLVLSDHSLPQFSSIKALEVVKAEAYDIPFIVVSGNIGEELAVQLIRAGATDYLIKDRLSRLGESVRQALVNRDLHRKQRESDMQIAILGRAIESSPSAIAIANIDGTITYANDTFHKMFNVDVHDNKSFNLIWNNSTKYDEILSNLNKFGCEPLHGELVLESAYSENARIIQYSASQVVSNENRIDCLMVNLVDISDQKKSYELQAALEREQALHQIRNRFTSMLVHDFRNPVASIQLILSTIMSYASKFTLDQILEKIERALNNTYQLDSLIDDVLMIGKLEDNSINLDMEPIDYVAYCKKVLLGITSNLITSRPSIEFVSNLNEVTVKIDVNYFERAIKNLILNAIKYSDEKTQIEVELDSDGNNALLKIKDHGIGIHEDDLPQIFDRFFRASNVKLVSGTGLGLSIVKFIVDSHDGHISCESQLGEGTTFTIALPIWDQSGDQRKVIKKKTTNLTD